MMNARRTSLAILLLGLSSLACSKPIIVTFGTNTGPIIPREETTPFAPRTNIPKDPAPVSEDSDDVPNPNTYRPWEPRQYKTKLLAAKPNPNLILGTLVDQRYIPSFEKYELYKKDARTAGIDYTGPHFFERQPYEYRIFRTRGPGVRTRFTTTSSTRTPLQPSVSYNKQQYFENKNEQNSVNADGQTVPQIGIVYSSGVRYYVPQVALYNQEEQENSVYDQEDEKHFYREN